MLTMTNVCDVRNYSCHIRSEVKIMLKIELIKENVKNEELVDSDYDDPFM